MTFNVLITGASDYLGGTLLARWHASQLSGYDKLYAFIRKPEQAEIVQQKYGAEPIQISLEDEGAVQEEIVSKRINLAFFLIDSYNLQSQTSFIKALSALKTQTGLDALDTNCRIVELGLVFDVKTYVFSPCIVYGKGEGFGNPISIQTVDVVNAALAAKNVYSVTDPSDKWPVCNLSDTTSYAISILRAILEGRDLDHGRNGFYLASSGRVCWMDLYRGVAKALHKRGLIVDDCVRPITEEARMAISKGLGVTPDSIELKIAGNSWYEPDHAKAVGWKAQYPPEHILEVIDDEVSLF